MRGMSFHWDECLEVLERTPRTLEAWLAALPDAWVRAREQPDVWSALDVVGHLIDGERTDWIPRARLILEGGSERTFEPFDRHGTIEDHRQRPLAELLRTFATLRAENLATLRGLDISEATLSRRGTHPELGPVTLSQLLATWTVHDLAHLAQIGRTLARHLKPHVGPWDHPNYLGVLQ